MKPSFEAAIAAAALTYEVRADWACYRETVNLGIDTFTKHLDQPDWDAYKQWSQGDPPKFAGRNFLGGDFHWTHAEATDALKAPQPADHPKLNLLVELVAPMQGPQPQRQSLTGDLGRLSGAIDAQVLCEKIRNRIYVGEFGMEELPVVVVWLAIDPSAPLTTDYWAGWADTVNTFTMLGYDPVRNLGPVTQPFTAGALLRYTRNASAIFEPEAATLAAITAAPGAYPGLDTRCWGFWADAPVWEISDSGAVALDWAVFSSASRPAIWRFAHGIRTNDGKVLNDYNVDVTDPESWIIHFMLVAQPWQPAAAYPFQLGFSTAESVYKVVETILKVPMPTMPDHENAPHTTSVPGGIANVIGRYIRHDPAVSLGLAEATILSLYGCYLFTPWESFNSAAGSSPTVLSYFSNGATGTSDGQDAFRYAAEVLHQPPQTPIYFAVDFDFPNTNDAAAITAANSDLKKYFDNVKSQRDAYASAHPGRYYLIGVYGNGLTLAECYANGVVTFFWQAVGSGETGSVWPNWPWPHSNRWQYQADDPGLTPPMVPWVNGTPPKRVVPGADPDADWGDGGQWTLLNPNNARLTLLEAGTGAANELRHWAELLTPEH